MPIPATAATTTPIRMPSFALLPAPVAVRLHGAAVATLCTGGSAFVSGRPSLAIVFALPAIAPLEVLHHHVRRAVFERPDIVHACDVFALDLDRRARLA